jgi:hypothetical protein
VDEDISLEQEYIAATTEFLPVGSRGELVRAYRSKGYQLLPDSLAMILKVAGRFRTLTGHRKALLEAGWQDDGSGFMEAALRELVKRGLLYARQDFLKTIESSATRSETPPRIGSLGWITRDRPSLLKKSLESYIRNPYIREKQVDFQVFDGSPHPETRASQRGMIAEIAQAESVPILYAGEEEKRRFARRIAERSKAEGLPPEVLEFALFDPFGMGYTAGANTNAYLLATSGELGLKIDDDTVCRFSDPPEPESGLGLYSLPDPTHIRFFPDRESLSRSASPFDIDILACHEQLLGRTVAECLRSREPPQQIDCGGMTPGVFRTLEAEGGRVLATMTGVCGDSGMGSPRMFLGLTGSDRELLVNSEEEYRRALMSRQVLRAVSRPTVSQGALFMAMNCGFDSRQALPPLFPVLRNSDGIFAHMLRACRPEGLIGHLPAAVAHQQQEARRFVEGEQRKAAVSMADLVILLIKGFEPGPGRRTPAQGVQALGRYLEELAALEPGEFTELCQRSWVAEMSRYIGYLDELLASYHYEPRYWAEDVEAHLREIENRIVSNEALVPEDVTERIGRAAAPEVCRELVGTFGRLLRWWPVIADSARTLASEGATLFT